MDLNKAQVIGNVTQDIELKQTPNGQNVTSFSVATNRNWTDSS
jgi:single-strand DNA-binding protein